jgi:Ca2+/Na+ antiporter
MQTQHSRLQLILPVMLIVSVVFGCYVYANMHINRRICVLFTLMYVGYIAFSWT